MIKAWALYSFGTQMWLHVESFNFKQWGVHRLKSLFKSQRVLQNEWWNYYVSILRGLLLPPIAEIPTLWSLPREYGSDREERRAYSMSCYMTMLIGNSSFGMVRIPETTDATKLWFLACFNLRLLTPEADEITVPTVEPTSFGHHQQSACNLFRRNWH